MNFIVTWIRGNRVATLVIVLAVLWLWPMIRAVLVDVGLALKSARDFGRWEWSATDASPEEKAFLPKTPPDPTEIENLIYALTSARTRSSAEKPIQELVKIGEPAIKPLAEEIAKAKDEKAKARLCFALYRLFSRQLELKQLLKDDL